MSPEFIDIVDGIGPHLLYFVISLALIALFIVIYIRITPYPEFALLREGNVAAAVSLGGALLGFAQPLARAVAQSGSLADLLIWGLVALIAQIAAFLIVRLVMPHLVTDIRQGKLASAIFLAAVSVAIGAVNAAAMTE